jgi:hypothetical protein
MITYEGSDMADDRGEGDTSQWIMEDGRKLQQR